MLQYSLVLLSVLFVLNLTYLSIPSEKASSPLILEEIRLEEKRLHFVMCWTTSTESFLQRHWSSIESLLLMHPASSVVVLATELPTQFFLPLTRRGYDVTVSRLNGTVYDSLAQQIGGPSQRWIERRKQLKAHGRFFYSHLTDFLRFAWLYVHGGSYVDFDVLWVNALPRRLRNAAGLDAPDGAPCAFCLPSGRYLAPGVLLSFRARHLTFRYALDRFFDVATYDPNVFNSVGPRAMTLSYEATRNASSVLCLPTVALYPWSWRRTAQMFLREPSGDFWVSRVTSQSLAVHLYGKVSAKLPMQSGSVVDRLSRSFSCGGKRSVSVWAPPAVALGASSPLRVVDCTVAPERPAVYVGRRGAPSPHFTMVGGARNRALNEWLSRLKIPGNSSALSEVWYINASVRLQDRDIDEHASFTVYNVARLVTRISSLKRMPQVTSKFLLYQPDAFRATSEASVLAMLHQLMQPGNTFDVVCPEYSIEETPGCRQAKSCSGGFLGLTSALQVNPLGSLSAGRCPTLDS